jgi:hypothetical protein
MRITALAITLSALTLSAPAFAQSANRSAPAIRAPQAAAASVAESRELRDCRAHCASLSVSGKSVSNVAQADARHTACGRKMIKGR